MSPQHPHGNGHQWAEQSEIRRLDRRLEEEHEGRVEGDAEQNRRWTEIYTMTCAHNEAMRALTSAINNAQHEFRTTVAHNTRVLEFLMRKLDVGEMPK